MDGGELGEAGNIDRSAFYRVPSDGEGDSFRRSPIPVWSGGNFFILSGQSSRRQEWWRSLPAGIETLRASFEPSLLVHFGRS